MHHLHCWASVASKTNILQIVPGVWMEWMELLKAVPNSKLWLLSWNDAGKESLLQHAMRHGVPQSRLVFTTFFEEQWHVMAL